MENLLRNIPGVVIYIDDVLITGSDEKSHLAALEEVLKRMEKASLRLNVNKCLFMAPQVTFLGYKIDAQGLHPCQTKSVPWKMLQAPRTPLS